MLPLNTIYKQQAQEDESFHICDILTFCDFFQNVWTYMLVLAESHLVDVYFLYTLQILLL